MKVLYLTSTLKNSGPTNVLLNIIKNLDRNKFNPAILTLSPEPKNSSIQLFIKCDVELYFLNKSRINWLFGKRSFSQLVEKVNPDIIHSQGFRADHLISKYCKNYPKIITVHNFPFYDYPLKYGKLFGTLLAKIHTNAIKKLSKSSVACSSTIQSQFLNNCEIEIGVIKNGINTDRYTLINNSEVIEKRKKLGFPEKSKIFIIVGSLIERKDVITTINSFKLHKDYNSLLLIVGDGPEKDFLIRKSDGDNRIRFLGKISNVDDYLQISDFYISASKAEGLPLSVIEAMSCGLPCILSTIPSHFEILSQNNEYLVKYFNIGDSNKLRKIMDYPCAPYNNKRDIRNYIEANFSSTIMSNKFQELYKCTVNNHIEGRYSE